MSYRDHRLVEVTDNGCWLWTGFLTRDGYASLRHRKSYLGAKGPIPASLQIDHLCKRRNCLNPDHMEPVTAAENTRRAWLGKTSCKDGHPLSGDNLRMRGGRRVCKACDRRRHREAKERRLSA